MGMFAQEKNQKLRTQGQVWNMKKAGLKWQFVFKNHYMFYVVHSKVNKQTKIMEDYTWKYWTDDVSRVLAWFNQTDKPWGHKEKGSATGLYILTPEGPQLVKMIPGSEYTVKAHITGRVWWETNQRVLPNECFSHYSSKA